MYSRWTQHLKTEEEKEKFKNEIYGAKRVLDHLLSLVEEDVERLDKSEQDQKVYDVPNWDYRQAHKNGLRQYAGVMKLLLDLDQQKGN